MYRLFETHAYGSKIKSLTTWKTFVTWSRVKHLQKVCITSSEQGRSGRESRVEKTIRRTMTLVMIGIVLIEALFWLIITLRAIDKIRHEAAPQLKPRVPECKTLLTNHLTRSRQRFLCFNQCVRQPKQATTTANLRVFSLPPPLPLSLSSSLPLSFFLFLSLLTKYPSMKIHTG